MLDFLGFIATAALMVLAVNAVITFLDVFAKRETHSRIAGRAGKDLRDRPLLERRARLKEIVPSEHPFLFSEEFRTVEGRPVLDGRIIMVTQAMIRLARRATAP